MNSDIVDYLSNLHKDQPNWVALRDAIAFFRGTIATPMELHHCERIDTMVSMLSQPRNEESRAADVGCNWGVLTYKLAESGFRSFAIDTYPRLFDKILIPISQLLGIRNRIVTHVGRGEDLPYANGYFELVVCGEVIEPSRIR